jgi:hypothetical protein
MWPCLFTQNKEEASLSFKGSLLLKRARQAVKHPFSDVRGRSALQTPPCSIHSPCLRDRRESGIEPTTSESNAISTASISLNCRVVRSPDFLIFILYKCNCRTEQAVSGLLHSTAQEKLRNSERLASSCFGFKKSKF